MAQAKAPGKLNNNTTRFSKFQWKDDKKLEAALNRVRARLGRQKWLIKF